LGLAFVSLNNKAFDLYVQFIAQFLYFTITKMEKEKKQLIDDLTEIRSYLHDRTCWTSDWLCKIREILENNWLEDEYYQLRENYKTYDEFEQILKDWIDNWLSRLYYILRELWIEKLQNFDVYYVDNYWNAENAVTYNDLCDVIDSIIKDIKKKKVEIKLV